MGKKRKNNDPSKNVRKQKQNDAESSSNNFFLLDHQTIQENVVIGWFIANKYYVIMCVLAGVLLGSGLGTAVFISQTPRMFLDLVLLRPMEICFNMFSFTAWVNFLSKSAGDNGISSNGLAPYKYFSFNGKTVAKDDTTQLTFAILREAIISQKGGFVHPDLGILSPAPSGATRGLGMIRDTFTACQVRCMPGTVGEKLNERKDGEYKDYPPYWNASLKELDTKEKLQSILDKQEEIKVKYRQEEVLLVIPLKMQMTRYRALKTLIPLIPKEVLSRAPLFELDDAALLVLLLAHEHGLGENSMFYAYISSLPLTPSCGFSPLIRTEALETINIMGVELGLDVNGWPGELSKASDRAQLITDGLARDYGNYISIPKGMSASSVIQWALCHVASRATAASERFGALRLIPILDMINHDVNAGGFEELTGKERLENGGFIDASEGVAGAFVVRSLQHGRRKPLLKGQELLANYHVPNYSPLDWFVSLGFVPPERRGKWTKVENVLPKSRAYGG